MPACCSANKDDGRAVWGRGRSVLIVRVTLDRVLLEDERRRNTAWRSIPPKRLNIGRDGSTRNACSPAATCEFELATVDTGERKEMFRACGRHVRTHEQTPNDSHSRSQETSQDGW